MAIENPYIAPGDHHDDDDEDDAPDDIDDDDDDDDEPPKVIRWFKVYAIVMSVVFGFVFFVCIALVIGVQFVPEKEQGDRIVMTIMGVLYGLIGLVLAIPYTMAAFLPRKPWVWVFDLVMICLGLTSPCCMPATIPLLIFWLKPDARAHFGRE